MFIPFSSPYFDDKEIDAVSRVLKSGWITTGNVAFEFEKNFLNYLGLDDKEFSAISVNSATAGLHLALEACGIKEGDEVILPSLTFASTAEVVRYLGAEVILADIDYKTMNICTDDIKTKITSKTKAIMPVHYAGLSCDMSNIINIAQKNNLKIIEDAAHALPTTNKGEIIGSLNTEASVFSFYANKSITTGEGGMIITRKKDLAKRMKIMRLHGIDRDVFERFTSDKPSWFYQIIDAGYKYNLTDIAAAIGIEQLKKLPQMQRKRARIAEKYNAAFKDTELITPYFDDNELHAWHLYVIRLKKPDLHRRNSIIEKLSKEGIGTSIHYIPLHMHPFYRKRYSYSGAAFANTTQAYNSMISLPIYPQLESEKQEHIIESVKQILLEGL